MTTIGVHETTIVVHNKHMCVTNSDTYITDINECLDANGGCQQICSNFPGSYYCSCNNGFMLNEDNHNCSGMLLNVHMYVHMCLKA